MTRIRKREPSSSSAEIQPCYYNQLESKVNDEYATTITSTIELPSITISQYSINDINDNHIVLKANALIILANLFYTTNDALIQISKLKISQLVFTRFLCQLFFGITWWTFNRPYGYSRFYGDNSKQKIIILCFAVLCSIGSISHYYAMTRLPVGDALCILSQAPILVALFGKIFLNESSSIFIIILLSIISTIGVIMICKPTFLTTNGFDNIDQLDFGGVIAMIISTIFNALRILILRISGCNDIHFIQLEIMASLQNVLISVPILLIFNEYFIHNDDIGDIDGIWNGDWSFDQRSLIITISIGCFGFAASSFFNVGAQTSEISKIAWSETTTLVFGFLYQIFYFNQIPDIFEIVGAVCLICTTFLSIICGIQ